MKKTFLTSGRISYQLPSLTFYESIRETSLGKKFPSLMEGAKVEVREVATRLPRPELIVTAPSAQARQTAAICADYFKVSLTEEICLMPLKFDIAKFLTEEQFNQLGKEAFHVLRKDFIEAFFENKLLESNLEIEERFKFLKQRYNKGEVLFISHAFLIKLLKIYSQIGDEMFNNKALLLKLFNPSRPPLDRLEFLEIEF